MEAPLRSCIRVLLDEVGWWGASLCFWRRFSRVFLGAGPGWMKSCHAFDQVYSYHSTVALWFKDDGSFL